MTGPYRHRVVFYIQERERLKSFLGGRLRTWEVLLLRLCYVLCSWVTCLKRRRELGKGKGGGREGWRGEGRD